MTLYVKIVLVLLVSVVFGGFICPALISSADDFGVGLGIGILICIPILILQMLKDLKNSKKKGEDK